MTQYLISFGADALDHDPDEDAPAVARAARAAVQPAIPAGVSAPAGAAPGRRRPGAPGTISSWTPWQSSAGTRASASARPLGRVQARSPRLWPPTARATASAVELGAGIASSPMSHSRSTGGRSV